MTEQFAMRTIAMLESPAFRVLSRAAHLVLYRLEIELAHHAGKENGRLIVTFNDFHDYGIHRHAIAPAIRELEALGFIEVTVQGVGGNAEWRRPSRYRLTWKHTDDDLRTDDWKRIQTLKQAEQVAHGARLGPKSKASDGKRHVSVTKTGTETRTRPVTKTGTTSRGAESATTVYISGEGGRLGGGGGMKSNGSGGPLPKTRQQPRATDQSVAGRGRVVVHPLPSAPRPQVSSGSVVHRREPAQRPPVWKR